MSSKHQSTFSELYGNNNNSIVHQGGKRTNSSILLIEKNSHRPSSIKTQYLNKSSVEKSNKVTLNNSEDQSDFYNSNYNQSGEIQTSSSNKSFFPGPNYYNPNYDTVYTLPHNGSFSKSEKSPERKQERFETVPGPGDYDVDSSRSSLRTSKFFGKFNKSMRNTDYSVQPVPGVGSYSVEETPVKKVGISFPKMEKSTQLTANLDIPGPTHYYPTFSNLRTISKFTIPKEKRELTNINHEKEESPTVGKYNLATELYKEIGSFGKECRFGENIESATQTPGPNAYLSMYSSFPCFKNLEKKMEKLILLSENSKKVVSFNGKNGANKNGRNKELERLKNINDYEKELSELTKKEKEEEIKLKQMKELEVEILDRQNEYID